jgi:hypothetical protein
VLQGFVSKGEVSCVNSDVTKSVAILRDTGASQTLMLDHILPEPLCESDGSCIFISGIGSVFISVPLRQIMFKSELVVGNVSVGIVPHLPIQEAGVLSGKDLAGSKVATVPHMCSKLIMETNDHLENRFPGLFPSCIASRAMSQLVNDEVSLCDSFFAEGRTDIANVSTNVDVDIASLSSDYLVKIASELSSKVSELDYHVCRR